MKIQTIHCAQRQIKTYPWSHLGASAEGLAVGQCRQTGLPNPATHSNFYFLLILHANGDNLSEVLEPQKYLLNSDHDGLLLYQQQGCIQLQRRGCACKGSRARHGVEPSPKESLKGMSSFTPIPTQPCAALTTLDKEQLDRKITTEG